MKHIFQQAEIAAPSKSIDDFLSLKHQIKEIVKQVEKHESVAEKFIDYLQDYKGLVEKVRE